MKECSTRSGDGAVYQYIPKKRSRPVSHDLALVQMQDETADIDPDEDYRRRNALYSRRNYYKVSGNNMSLSWILSRPVVRIFAHVPMYFSSNSRVSHNSKH